jgi:hypothetical protein
MSRPLLPIVLHVVERPTQASSDFDRAIAQAGFEAEWVDSVYAALARLLRPGDEPARAVLICIDTLEASELEFFTLAARRCPDVPLYIYGESVTGDRRQRALALGAQSELTAARVVDVLSSLTRAEPAEKPPEPPLPQGEPTVTVEEPEPMAAPAPQPAPEAAPSSQSDVGSPEGDVAEDAEAAPPEPPHGGQVPTPWQPASGRPQRVPPGARAQTGPRTDQDRAPSDQEADEGDESIPQPVLSPQEVNALLSGAHPSQRPEESIDDESG